jgi:poly(3-hydroxyalkanoate) synthetase
MMHRISKRNRYAKIIDFVYEKLKERGPSTARQMREWMFDENNRSLDITRNALANVLAQNKLKFRKLGMKNGVHLWEAVE